MGPNCVAYGILSAGMHPLQGAVYATNNAAYTWSAAVQETVDATLNRTVSSGALLTCSLLCWGFAWNVF